jgi:hypothetical protein
MIGIALSIFATLVTITIAAALSCKAVVIGTTSLADIPATAGRIAGTIAVETTFGARRAWLALLFLLGFVIPFAPLLLRKGVVERAVPKQAERGERPEGRATGGGSAQDARQGIEATIVHGRLHDVSRFR